MARFTYFMPLCAAGLLLAGCPGDDTSGSGGSDTGTTSTDPTGDTDPGSGSGMADSTTGTEPDPCDGVMCAANEVCVAGVCVENMNCDPPCADGEVCEGGVCVPDICGVDGVYDPCFGTSCPAGYQCIVDNVANPTVSWCAFQGCTDGCDCPTTPDGYEADCQDFTGAGMNQCAIQCGAGGMCPEGMICFQGAICAHSSVDPEPQYGDCINGGICGSGQLCIADMDMTFGWCGTLDCVSDDECQPPPGTGDAPAVCTPINEMTSACALDCSGGETCPDGMTCLPGIGLCAWTPMAPPSMDPPGYGDCVDNPLETCGDPAEDTCITDDPMTPTAGACSVSGCADAMGCPAAPPTGDAVVTCGDLGNGNTCYLDCSGGETCPDGMACTGGTCMWTEDGFVLDEDFQLGQFRPGWSVNDVDGNTVDPGVGFVTDAWIVGDQTEPGMNFAAYSTSWYAPAGMADDWLITPQIMLGPGSMLTWDGMTPDAMFADGYEVYVSTAGPDPADFMMNAPVFTIAAEAQMFTAHSVDLAAEGYADQLVYIAWRNNSNDAFLLLIDNVQVTQ